MKPPHFFNNSKIPLKVVAIMKEKALCANILRASHESTTTQAWRQVTLQVKEEHALGWHLQRKIL